MLDKINKIVNLVRKYKKLEDKQNILKKYITDIDVRTFLEYCYSPYKNYYITKNELQKNSNFNELEFGLNLFSICDQLNNQELTR